MIYNPKRLTPGSEEAQQEGCLCESYGREEFIDEECPLHGGKHVKDKNHRLGKFKDDDEYCQKRKTK